MCPARNATQNPIPYERTRYVYNTRQAFKSLYSQLAKTGNCCLGRVLYRCIVVYLI